MGEPVDLVLSLEKGGLTLNIRTLCIVISNKRSL